MKKITLLFFTLLLSVTSWRVSGQYFSDGFEGSFPSPWTHVQTNIAETWASTAVTFHGGAQSIQCDYDASLGLQNEVMMSPVINLSASTAPQVSFWFLMSYYWGVDPNDNYDLKVEGTINGGATSTVLWTESAQGVFANWTWYQVTVPLTAFVGQSNFQLILRYEGSDGAQGNFDDILVEEAPSCPAPSALTATGVTSSSAVLGWTAGGTESAWNIEYGPTGFTLGTGTIVNGITNPYTLPGLSASTTYQYYVQASCGGAAGNSTWVGPMAFTTACGPFALPWNEGFESAANPALPNCWFKENGDWVTAINSGSTYDADAHTGTKFLRESWSATNEYVWTPGFNLVAGTSYDFSFWWAGDTYAGWQGDVFYNTTQLSTGATQMGGSFVALTDVTTKTYAKATRTFVPSTSGTYYFAVRVNCPTATPWYLSLDDFKLEETPACPAPTALALVSKTATSATFGWTAGASETQWDIEWGVEGFTLGTGTMVTATSSNPYTLNGLTYGVSYSAYVRANCGSGQSTWVGPLTWKYLDAPNCVTVVSPADGATGISGYGNITFEWAAATTGEPAVSYNFYYGATASTVTSLLGNFATTTTVALVGSYNYTLYWKIVPVNANGQEATGCPVWSFTTESSPGYCLVDDYGQWPSSAYTPSTCDGVTANVITTAGYASEYSVVNLTAGQTYQFVSSVVTDFITISADAGVTAVAYGVTPVTWTSNVTGPVRFYTHTNDQCGASNVNRTRSVLCGGSLGIADNHIDGFKMYPNPVTNVLIIDALNAINAVSVYNMLGQEVVKSIPSTTQVQLDMTALPVGAYVVKVQAGSQLGSYSLIKQ